MSPIIEPHQRVFNLMTGRQRRAARVLAGVTQKTLGASKQVGIKVASPLNDASARTGFRITFAGATEITD